MPRFHYTNEVSCRFVQYVYYIYIQCNIGVVGSVLRAPLAHCCLETIKSYESFCLRMVRARLTLAASAICVSHVNNKQCAMDKLHIRYFESHLSPAQADTHTIYRIFMENLICFGYRRWYQVTWACCLFKTSHLFFYMMLIRNQWSVQFS